MSSEPALPMVELTDVSKCYHVYSRPVDRLRQFVMPRLRRLWSGWGRDRYFREFWSLQPLSVSLAKGEVLGIIGVNGAGKSTLLQLVTGVLQPTTGEVQVRGRVAALLELGAGFNPEFTGRENVYLNAALLGLERQEIDRRFCDIVEFSGIAEFIDQPVKTYSSGMYVRLAFSIATCVDPDVLIIDEALSVGDGAFARKSFDRIMALKDSGVTILFCSHNVYQVEAMSQRVLWLDHGQVRALGDPASVCQLYNQFLEGTGETSSPAPGLWTQANGGGVARIEHVRVSTPERSDGALVLVSQQSTLLVDMGFFSSVDMPCPTVAVIITDDAGRNISSCGSFYDQVAMARDAEGYARVRVRFPRIQLLRGQYVVNVFLLCEKAIHIYDSARCADIEVTQPGLEIGVVALQREWETP